MNKPADEFQFRDVVDLVFGPLRDLLLFRQARVDKDLGTIVWPTGADIDPGVLYDWSQHVDATVQRRRQRFATDTSVLLGVQQ